MNNKLKDKIKDLRDQLTDLLVEKEEMLTIGYQELNASYSEKLGKYEIHLYEREYEYVRLRRKIDLIRQQHDKGNTDIDLYTLDKKLDDDYKDFRLRINSRRKVAEESEEFFAEDKLSLQDYNKMRSLYWQIARSIHPELSKDENYENNRTWKKVSDAFVEGDLYTIETYAISLSDDEENIDISDELLEEEKDYLERKIKETSRYMSSLSKIHPYNKKAMLDDMEELHEKKLVVEEKTESVDKKIKDLENQLIDLLLK